MKHVMQCFATPTIQSEKPHLIQGIVFKEIENPSNLKHWLKELRIAVKVYKLEQVKHNQIFKRVFPNTPMGRHVILIECETEDGFNFIRNHRPFERTTASVVLDLSELL